MRKIFTFILLSFFSFAAFSQVRISQVYGGGGNGGATYNQDFVEIFNAGAADVAIGDWSVQYASATGPSGAGNWAVASIPTGTILGAGKYFLVGLATGATGVALPAPDLTNTTINLSGSAGKVALVNNGIALNGTTACSSPTVVDVLGYGATATCFETAAAITAGITNVQSILRSSNGCTDANNNSTDFSIGTVLPRNSSSAANSCSGGAVLSAGPAITSLSTTPGVASASQSFTVSGSGLTGFPGNITLTSGSASFEISLSSGSGFGSSVTIPYASATLAATLVYVRISATAALGAVNSTITVSGGGASNAVVNVAGNVLSPEPTIQATNVLLTNLANTSLDINWTNGNGTSRIVVIRQTATTAVLPADGTTYVANTDIALAATTGPGNYVVFNGPGNGPVSVTGLTAGISYTVTVFEFNGTAGSANYLTAAAAGNPAAASTTGISPNLTQLNFTTVSTPQYMGSGTATRTLTMFYARVSNLTPNTVYRYYVQAGVATDLGTTNTGAGNPLLIDYTVSPVTYTYTSSPSLSLAGGYAKFTTDAAGSFAGSFGFVNTGNARFTAGNAVFPTIALSVDPATTPLYRFALNQTITVLAFAATNGPTDGTFIQGTSSAIPGNLVALWDNTTAVGRPLSMTMADEPAVISGNGGAAWHTSFISGYDSANGSWNTIIPNNNANGIRLIQQFDIITGNVLGCNSDADGTWPTGPVVTSNPTGGITPLQISAADAPLNTGSCFSILPIRLEYIRGHKTTSGIALNWRVTCLSTNIVMQVERSADTRNFKPVNSIAATQERCNQPFDFTDARPLKGNNYYRLKMIDIDGKISYSPIVVIINGGTGFEFVGLFPSIVKNNTSLSVSSAKAAVIETRITDISGRLIKTYKQSVPAGSSLINIDCGNLARGIYNLTGIAEDASVKTIRFIKL